jgi:hypothetical protein
LLEQKVGEKEEQQLKVGEKEEQQLKVGEKEEQQLEALRWRLGRGRGVDARGGDRGI